MTSAPAAHCPLRGNPMAEDDIKERLLDSVCCVGELDSTPAVALARIEQLEESIATLEAKNRRLVGCLQGVYHGVG